MRDEPDDVYTLPPSTCQREGQGQREREGGERGERESMYIYTL